MSHGDITQQMLTRNSIREKSFLIFFNFSKCIIQRIISSQFLSSDQLSERAELVCLCVPNNVLAFYQRHGQDTGSSYAYYRI